jgi:PAS domain S-box-containing protein
MQQSDLCKALEMALRAGSVLMDASYLAVYQADGGKFELKRCAEWGTGDLFPDHVHPNDLVILDQPSLWVTGKRPMTQLHRAARSSGLRFLASAPLGQPNARIGLLAIAGEKANPSERTLGFLPILAGSITTILQNQALTVNLQEHLQNKETQLAIKSAIVESALNGIIIISPDLTILELNPSAESILGYATQEIRGQPYQNVLVSSENLSPLFTVETDENSIDDLGNIRLYRRDGKAFLAHVRILSILTEHRPECFVVLIQDLSEEEQYRNLSQRLEKQAGLGQITAIFAHEVRNPINNISTGLQLIAMNLPGEDSNQEVISRLLQDCDRLEELMKAVLNFSKQTDYKMEPVDLGEALKRLLERWRPRLLRANIKHFLQFDPKTPPILGDVRALEQVWNNLFTNAMQAMEQQGGSLTVKVRPVTTPDDTQRVEVIVSDTGTGISDEIRDEIFKPFFTASRNGTGLGLAVTMHVLTAHKGTIDLISIPGGTAFQVLLPIAD